MTELIIKILSLGGVAAVFAFGCKYVFFFNFRYGYKKKKFGLIKTGLENLKKLFDEQYENPNLPPYLLQAAVNEHLISTRYKYKIIFFFMKYEALNIEESAKAVDSAWPFLKVVEVENNKVELRTKYTLEQIKKRNKWCLMVYVILGLLLILAQWLESYVISWITIDRLLIIVPIMLLIMFVAAWFGIKFTSITALKKMVKFGDQDLNP
ncbi:hypothetical protein [Acinetobacter pittii]|uniref:hypothetical protein n=1 Tax=Acinetobacter pittii TaxID=48296 RepID=UPI001F070511|nr:hypothetical protein [Acinetobacter pittii]MCH2072347.1 hypothetical protein [Acinetobacter pittii]